MGPAGKLIACLLRFFEGWMYRREKADLFEQFIWGDLDSGAEAENCEMPQAVAAAYVVVAVWKGRSTDTSCNCPVRKACWTSLLFILSSSLQARRIVNEPWL